MSAALPMVQEQREPSPQHLHPCCPITETDNQCQYRPGMIRSYLFALRAARLYDEPWEVVLADKLDCACGHWRSGCRCPPERRALLTQSNRGRGSLGSRARDIVLSLEHCRDDLGIPLTYANVDRLARALCRFSCSLGD